MVASTVAKAWLVTCVMVCSCVSHQRPVPLYAASEKPASPSEVATLYGDVRDVDGKVVSAHGGTFELLPGCHVVGVVETWARMGDYSGVIAHLPRIAFAMPMRGGYRYVVEVVARMGSVDGTVTITAREEDGEGNVTNKFPPQSDEQAVMSCGDVAER
jgi:hypothetical protein